MNLIFVLLGLFAVFFGFRKVANSLVDEVIEISIDHFSYKVDISKTKYIDIDEFSEKIKDCFKKYLKYGLKNIQIFSSLGASQGIGEHTDNGNVLIICLEGEIGYIIERTGRVFLKAGDTIFIKDNLLHSGISSTVPRICLSCEVQESIPSHEVTHFFG